MVAFAVGLLATWPASANSGWADTPQARLAVLAILEDLNGQLLTGESATSTLEAWCDHHHLAPRATIVADRVIGQDKSITGERRALLHVSPSEEVRYRRVRLRCGDHVLSEADNWYVPSRLTPQMNRVLDTTDEPFGRVVRDLHFQRRRLSARLLWRPLDENWDMSAALPLSAGKPLVLPPHVIEHHAVLLDGSGTPFSEVIETYTADVLGFPPPPIAH